MKNKIFLVIIKGTNTVVSYCKSIKTAEAEKKNLEKIILKNKKSFSKGLKLDIITQDLI